jgi:uncharacterized protein YukJ
MALAHYSLLKARPIDRRLGSGQSPHYQILCTDDTKLHRVAVNVQSQLAPSELEYLIVPNFAHPIVDALGAPAFAAMGLHRLASQPGGAALDYIRANLFDPRSMHPLPFSVPGPDNDLNEKLDHYVQRAMADEAALLFAFGETWGPENKRDKYFGFEPGSGIHDVHMNQGNVGSFVRDDGVWQDGGLFFHYPAQGQWVGVFLKFQSQAWHTDDATGHRLPEQPGGPPSDEEPLPPFHPGGLPTGTDPDGLVRIVGALVNDVRSPERETVTLLNTANRTVSIEGWAIADKLKHKHRLSGEIAAGATLLVELAKPAELSNRGGIITLLDDRGLRVDGVAYTREQARNPGWTIVF